MALALHLARLLVTLAALLVLGRGRPVVALAAAVFLYLAAFAFTHDLAHGALKLPRRINELFLTGVALLMGVSGHTMRRMHLKHHARPLSAGDVEGRGAALPFWKALAIGPMTGARYWVEALRGAPQRERRWMRVEAALALALTVAALLGRSVTGAAGVVVNVVMALTASLWASHLPHRPPRWLSAIARRLAWTRSAVVMSFAFHAEHHAHPKVPCCRLGSLGHPTLAA